MPPLGPAQLTRRVATHRHVAPRPEKSRDRTKEQPDENARGEDEHHRGEVSAQRHDRPALEAQGRQHRTGKTGDQKNQPRRPASQQGQPAALSALTHRLGRRSQRRIPRRHEPGKDTRDHAEDEGKKQLAALQCHRRTRRLVVNSVHRFAYRRDHAHREDSSEDDADEAADQTEDESLDEPGAPDLSRRHPERSQDRDLPAPFHHRRLHRLHDQVDAHEQRETGKDRKIQAKRRAHLRHRRLSFARRFEDQAPLSSECRKARRHFLPHPLRRRPRRDAQLHPAEPVLPPRERLQGRQIHQHEILRHRSPVRIRGQDAAERQHRARIVHDHRDLVARLDAARLCKRFARVDDPAHPERTDLTFLLRKRDPLSLLPAGHEVRRIAQRHEIRADKSQQAALHLIGEDTRRLQHRKNSQRRPP